MKLKDFTEDEFYDYPLETEKLAEAQKEYGCKSRQYQKVAMLEKYGIQLHDFIVCTYRFWNDGNYKFRFLDLLTGTGIVVYKNDFEKAEKYLKTANVDDYIGDPKLINIRHNNNQ